MRRRIVPLLPLTVVLGALLALVGPVAAKDGTEVGLDTAVPLGAEPGSTIPIGWHIVKHSENGQTPISAAPTYIRLVPPNGGTPVEAAGTERPEGSGQYAATITVPAGGIAAIEVAMRGTLCDTGGGCETVDLMFPLTDDAMVSGTAMTPAGASQATAGVIDLIPLKVILLTIAIAVAAGAAAAIANRRALDRQAKSDPEPAAT
jgi:hypothetical protein